MSFFREPIKFKNTSFDQLSVTSSRAAIPTISDPNSTSKLSDVLLQALSTNTGSITVGDSSVTAGGAGIELAPGGNWPISSNELSGWYAIAASGTQKLNIIYMSGTI